MSHILEHSNLHEDRCQNITSLNFCQGCIVVQLKITRWRPREIKFLVFPFDNKRRVKFYLVTDRKENSHFAQNRAPLFMCKKLLA